MRTAANKPAKSSRTKKAEPKTKGRPQIQINKKQFENLCGLQCTEEEIASFFDCSVDTIERFCSRTYNTTFAEVFKIKRGVGKISLRRSQMKLAEKYPAMAIFLGKQYLDQTDKVETSIVGIDETFRKEVEEFLNDNGAEDITAEDQE